MESDKKESRAAHASSRLVRIDNGSLGDGVSIKRLGYNTSAATTSSSLSISPRGNPGTHNGRNGTTRESDDNRVRTQAFIQTILKYQCSMHLQFLTPLVTAFNRVDDPGAGRISTLKLKALLRSLSTDDYPVIPPVCDDDIYGVDKGGKQVLLTMAGEVDEEKMSRFELLLLDRCDRVGSARILFTSLAEHLYDMCEQHNR